MRRTAVVLLASVILAPALAMAAGDGVALDAKVLSSAKVERNGKQIGTVQRVMIDPRTGRIEHLDILMTEGQQRVVAVPWSGVKLFQDSGGNMTVSLTSRAASEASPSGGSGTTVRTAPAVRTAAANDIAEAQHRLKERGYYLGPVDGVIGPDTTAALRAYQRDRGLDVTGQLDARTAGSLAQEVSAAPARTIRSAQQELKNLGYYAGLVDGLVGPATERALRSYQRDRGLSVTGRLDPATVRSLSS